MIFEKVCSIIADYKDIDPSSVTMESSFSQLGVDSLDTVELVMSFEDEFGITIEMDGSMKTIGDVVKRIEELTA